MIITLLPVFFSTYAQSTISFDHITVENGLSHSNVLSIGEDQTGFMWFGTKDGLNRYDSKSIRIYRNSESDKGSISSNYNIDAILADNRNHIWIGTINGLNKYTSRYDNFDRIFGERTNPHALSSNLIKCLYQDHNGRIWVGTNDGLNQMTDTVRYQFKRFFAGKPGSQAIINNDIHALIQDYAGNIWVGSNGGITKMTFKNGIWHFESFYHTDSPNSLADNDVSTIAEDRFHRIWVGLHYGGLELLNQTAGTFIHYTSGNGLVNNKVRKILVDGNGNLWIGTIKGISLLDPVTNKITNLTHDPDDNHGLNHNSVYDIFKDRNGTVWVGTMFGGVNVRYAYDTPFMVYQTNNHDNSISNNVVSGIIEDQKHNLWIGTEAEGVNYYERRKKVFEHFDNDINDPYSLGSNLVKTIYEDKKGRVWIGTVEGGLNLFDPSTRHFKRFLNDPANPRSISSNKILCILEDSQGRFWVGTDGYGLNLFDRSTATVQRFMTNPVHRFPGDDIVKSLYEDSRHNLWIGTQNCLAWLPAGTNRLQGFLKDKNDNRALKDDNINFVTGDSKGRIWVGTYTGGLSLYLGEGKGFRTYNITDGLPSNNVVGLLDDKQSNLWVASQNGLSKFNPATNRIINYNTNDGLPSNQFNYNSFFKDRKGEFYFGTDNGMVAFLPGQLKQNRIPPKLVFTGLKVAGKPISIGDESQVLKEDMSVIPKVILNYKQNIFSVEFSALNFIKPRKNKYAYRLAGFENKWNDDGSGSASYANLPAGNYILEVKASNNDGVWSGVSRLPIQISAAPWATWWAYTFYLIAFLSILFVIMRFIWIRQRLKNEHSLNESKLAFYTNISHEIRTPLTLILGPLEQVLQEIQAGSALHRQMQQIKANADRILRLVTELMDFRKVETGHMILQVSRGNIVNFVTEIFLAFQNNAISKNIDYTLNCDANNLEAYFDKDQFEKVIYNLLSNAFKFTPDNGRISVEVKDANTERLLISVADNGNGIPLEDQPHIFKDFYQSAKQKNAYQGTGIGLAFSKKIVELHKGTLDFSSTPATADFEGSTCFTISLLKGKAHFDPQDIAPESSHAEQTLHYVTPPELPMATEFIEVDPLSEKKYEVLVVDDNFEVSGFISATLQRQNYRTTVCCNGREGLEIAMIQIPDLIISDVMMPEMDGLEFCRRIKTDERTSHIPFILLTARTAQVHHVSGLQTGADAYIYKPFNIQVLELNVRNLIASKENTRLWFKNQLKSQPRNVPVSVADEKFLKKLIEFIESHFNDATFGVPMLAAEAGMSSPVLYKKLKTLTNMSVNDFVKSIRLKKAAYLLTYEHLSVSEVSYIVGFHERKYFSKEFRKQYGMTPTEYVNAFKNNDLSEL